MSLSVFVFPQRKFLRGTVSPFTLTFTRNEMRIAEDGGRDCEKREKERRMPSVMSPRSLEGESLVRVRPYQRSVRPSIILCRDRRAKHFRLQ